MKRMTRAWTAPLTLGLGTILVAVAFSLLMSARGVVEADAPLPSRPLPADYVEAFADGKVVALHYGQSFVCATTPGSDLDGPFGVGDGSEEAEDPKEYQQPLCFAGDTGTGSLLRPEQEAAAFGEVRPVYALVPFFGSAAFNANNVSTDVQTHCAQPGPPYTQVTGAPGTCLMHPTVIRVAKGTDPAGQTPDPVPAPNHSHVIEGNHWKPGWWRAMGVVVRDRAVFPDLDGNCPAGRDRCLTSVGRVKAAVATGQVDPVMPMNLYLYFGVTPEGGAG